MTDHAWEQMQADEDRTTAAADLAALAKHDLNLLPPLHALLDEGSVTRAAQRVGLSQPAMSHILSRCRRLLSDELLIRIGGNMELSTRARELREPLAQALVAVRAALVPEAVFDPTESTRIVSIAVSTGTATAVIPSLARRLSEVAPGMGLRIRRSLLPTEDLQHRPDIDLAILPDIIPTPHRRISLYTEEWMVIVDAENPHVHDRFDTHHLTGLEHIAYWSDGLIKPYRAIEAAGLSWRTRLTVHDFLALLFFVEGTEAMAIVPGHLAQSAQQRKRWRAFPLPLEVGTLQLDLVWNPRLRHDPLRPWLTGVLKALAIGSGAGPVGAPSHPTVSVEEQPE